MNDNKNNRLVFRVSDEELAFLKKKMQLTNCKNMSDFLRKISLQGAVYNVDLSEFSATTSCISSISRSINQIAKRVNYQKTIYKEDIDEIKRKVDEVWQQQKYILSLLRKLEP